MLKEYIPPDSPGCRLDPDTLTKYAGHISVRWRIATGCGRKIIRSKSWIVTTTHRTFVESSECTSSTHPPSPASPPRSESPIIIEEIPPNTITVSAPLAPQNKPNPIWNEYIILASREISGRLNKDRRMYCDENQECLMLKSRVDIIRNFRPKL